MKNEKVKEVDSVVVPWNLYLGCEVKIISGQYEGQLGKLDGFTTCCGEPKAILSGGSWEEYRNYISLPTAEIKLIARRLSDMTEEEMLHVLRLHTGFRAISAADERPSFRYFPFRLMYDTRRSKIKYMQLPCQPKNVAAVDYLRSRGFWLGPDSAFDSGQVIDKKSLK